MQQTNTNMIPAKYLRSTPIIRKVRAIWVRIADFHKVGITPGTSPEIRLDGYLGEDREPRKKSVSSTSKAWFSITTGRILKFFGIFNTYSTRTVQKTLFQRSIFIAARRGAPNWKNLLILQLLLSLSSYASYGNLNLKTNFWSFKKDLHSRLFL